jgi:hypothetical protein
VMFLMTYFYPCSYPSVCFSYSFLLDLFSYLYLISYPLSFDVTGCFKPIVMTWHTMIDRSNEFDGLDYHTRIRHIFLIYCLYKIVEYRSHWISSRANKKKNLNHHIQANRQTTAAIENKHIIHADHQLQSKPLLNSVTV